MARTILQNGQTHGDIRTALNAMLAETYLSLNRFDPFKFDFIGDSRTDNLTLGGHQTGFGTGGSHYFHQANAILGKRMKLGINRGRSGFRTDEYLAYGLNDLINSDALWAILSFPAVNNIAPNSGGNSTTFPYVNTNGVTVTLANVAAVAASDIIAAANALLAVGKRVVLLEEPGSTNFTTAQMTAVLAFNNFIRAYARKTKGITLLSFNAAIWNPTGSATQITFKPGVSIDGVHYTVLGGFTQGEMFAAAIGPQLPYTDNGPALLADTTANNPFQLIRNPLFNTLTGGTSSNVTLTGNVPGSWTLSASAAGLVTVTITNSAGAFGNRIRMELVATGAVTLAFECVAPANTDWNLSDTFIGGIDYSVASGATNFAPFWQTQLATNLGTLNLWDCYPLTFGNMPSDRAYSGRFRSPESGVMVGSTSKTYIAARARMGFSAAGSATIDFERPMFERYAA